MIVTNLIKRKDAIDNIRWEARMAQIEEDNDYVEMCVYAVHETDSADINPLDFFNSMWVPVTNRLPEEGTDVLVTGENGEVDIARWNYDSWTEDDVVVWDCNGYPFITPIAWMPLPRPWEGEGDDPE